jgi:hypothetical protein
MLQDLPGTAQNVIPQAMGPQHISPLVVYLASDKSAHITGQTLGIEGNRLFIYRMMTSHGTSKRGSSEPWIPDEIEKAMDQVLNW